MIVGIVYVELYLPQVCSLKEKRSVIKSLKQKILNVSISEVDFLDKWQRSALGLGVVTTETAHLDSVITKLESFIDQESRVIITRWDMRMV
jgi:uncharacterized protein YlxP (DUF503 family)